jgi:hypothetical protein
MAVESMISPASMTGREERPPRRGPMVTHENGGGHAHHPPSGFIAKYVFSIDHKVIGIQYLCLALFSVFVGMALSLLMRLHLAWPNAHWSFFKGGLMTPEQYLALMTMHRSPDSATISCRSKLARRTWPFPC